MLRPFTDRSDEAWGAIKQRLAGKFHWTDVRDLTRSGAIFEQILNEMARTHVIIVDITGNNPNVFFELGIARTANRKVKYSSSNAPATAIPTGHRRHRRNDGFTEEHS